MQRACSFGSLCKHCTHPPPAPARPCNAKFSVPQGCQDRILQIATRVSITVVLPSGLRKPVYVTPGAALATAIYLRNQATSPTLPDSMLTNQVSAAASARQGLCSFGLAISHALALHTLPGHAVWLRPRS